MNEVFKLVGTIALTGGAETKAEIDNVTDHAEGKSNKLGGAIAKVGSGIMKVGKAVAVGVTAMATGIAGVTSKSMALYGEYEQLVGGVETLFKDSSKEIMGYAKNAYKTAGLSANEYMQTITSFSASLLQSLKGDTKKASAIGNMAVQDMADNANKMGTSMEMIQNAYQGFAKQNYTMLDNLKLGYGGTKEEMKRLLEDANKLNAQQGKHTKYSLENMADIISAIHDVQVQMGITGTTAKEAEKTLQGSMSATKASWDNLLIGLADDNAKLGELIDTLIGNISTMAGNMLPRIKVIFEKIPSMITAISPKIGEMVMSLLPNLLKSAISLVSALVKSAPQIFKGLTQMLPSLVTTVINAVKELGAEIGAYLKNNNPLENIGEALSGLGGMIEEKMPLIISKGLELIEGLVGGIVKATPKLIEMGANLIKSLVIGLMKSLPTIIEKAPKIITDFANTISRAIPQLMLKGAEIIWEIIKGLVGAIPTLIANIPQIFKAIIAVWNAINWLNLGKTLVTGIWKGIVKFFGSFKTSVKGMFDGIKTSIDDVFMNIFASAKNIWGNITSSITSIITTLKLKLGMILNSIKGGFTSVWGGIKNITSSVFGAIKNIISSIWSGIKTSISGVLNGIKSTVSGVWNGIKSVTSNVWNGVLNAIKSPLTTAKNFVKGIVDKIKGFFNFKISFPKIPLPHFKIKPKGWDVGDLLKGKIPSLGIDWYAKGGILEQPTVFGINPSNGNAMVGGEAGKEAVAPISELMKYVRVAVDDSNNGIVDALERVISVLTYYLPTLSQMQLVLDTGALVGETAPLIDEELGRIKEWKGR